VVGGGEVVPGGEGVGVVGAPDPLPVGQGLIEDEDGLTELPGRVVGVGQNLAGGECAGVVGPQDALDVGEGLQLQLEGPTEIAGRQVCVGEVVARGEGVGVVGPSTRCLSVRVCSHSGMARPRFPADS
jgi:hypothetical protein